MSKWQNAVTITITVFTFNLTALAEQPYQIPEWFDGNRVQAHTRLVIHTWGKKPIFYTAAEGFQQMGVNAFTRFVKSHQSPCWWPSKVGQVMPEAENFNFVKKMIDNAHARGMHMIAYYRHMEDNYMAEKHPEWACRDWEGKVMPQVRKHLWMCFNTEYRQYVKTRLLELVDMGVDGFYFDYFHMPSRWLGHPKYAVTCCCKTCQEKYEKIYGRKMPGQVKYTDPQTKILADFYTRTITETFKELSEAVHERNPDCVMIISTTFTPSMHSAAMPSTFAAIADSAKTEWDKPAVWPRNIPKDVLKPDHDMRWAAGFTYLRGVCDDRPPHVWTYALWTKEEALSVAAACMTYGLVANIDIQEDEIPNMDFAPAFEMGNKVSPYLKRTKPMRWAAIHFDERLRDQAWPDERKIWKQVLWPALGPYEAFCRARLPVAYITDWQLEAGQLDGYKILVLPHPDNLTAAQQKQVAKFKAAGGIVMEIGPNTKFHDPKQHDQCVKKFLEQYQQLTPVAPIKVTGGPEDLHAVAWEKRDKSTTTLCLLNDFDWFSTRKRIIKRLPKSSGSPFTPPMVVQGVAVNLSSKRTPKKVFNAVTGKTLKPTKTQNGWQVRVPDFQYMAAVVYEW